MLGIGIDIGSSYTKAAAFDGQVRGLKCIKSGWNPKETSAKCMNLLMKKLNIKDCDSGPIVATGYGRNLGGFDKAVTEITCHARGANFMDDGVRTVIDIGGQDSKVISIDEAGNVKDFVMNDRCAAGTGRFIEVMAGILDCEANDLDRLAQGGQAVHFSSTCTVFAESEVVNLISKGTSREDIAAGLFLSVAEKINPMITRVGIRRKVGLSGGLGFSSSLRGELEKLLCTDITPLKNSQYMGAIGAAIIAYERTSQKT
jgi:predicted CoA-substrate-specific enzyme activase